MRIIFDSDNRIQDIFPVEGLEMKAARLDGCRCRRKWKDEIRVGRVRMK
jgi:hypothetical protein